MSSREELQAELAEQMQAFQARVDAFDELVAARLGVNRTDLRCVEILVAQRTASPGELGPALGLTTGGVTAMLIRLERLGYLRRVPHPDDGRKVIVEVTDEALRQVAALLVAGVIMTVTINVPLNDAIKAAGDPDRIADLAAVRSAFDESRWATWNLVRTVTTVVAFGILVGAL